MRSFRRPHRWLSALALAASLLLSLLPAAGRLQQAFAWEAQDDTVLAMCTVRGLEYLPASRVDGLSADQSAPQGDPGSASHRDDCAYCPLLSALDVPAPPAMANPVPASSSDDLRSPSDRGVFAAHRMGLGPRGPPPMVFAG
jgi:hypothetical protein